MEALIVGLAGIVIGSLVAMFGVRVFYLLLPVWGFLAGFALSTGVASLLDEGFLVTILQLGSQAGPRCCSRSWQGSGTGPLSSSWRARSASCGPRRGAAGGAGHEPSLLVFLAGLAGAAALVVLAIVIDAATCTGRADGVRRGPPRRDR